MKNVALALNAVLIIALGFLYYKVYSTDKPSGSKTTPISVSAKSSNIFYVNADSLFDNYQFFKTSKDLLSKKEDSIKNLLEKKSTSLQGEAAQYQQQAQGMTDAQRQQIESALMGKQESLVALKDQLLNKLQKEQEAMNDTINSHMQSKIKEFVKGKNITFILGYHKSGEVLYANDSLNITEAVIEDLNKK